MALRKEGRKAVLSINQRRSARLNKEKTMNNLFTKEKSTKGRDKFLLIIVLLVLLCGFLFWLAMEQWYPRYSNTAKTKAPSQPVVETNIPVPPKPIVAAMSPQQEAASPCCCPCPQKTKAVVHPKKKKVQQPRPTTPTAIASGVKGCVEIYLPKIRQDDIGVKGFIAGVNHDIAHDNCTGFKAEGDAVFKPLSNELCSSVLPIVCDSARQEAVIGHPARLKFSFFTKPGIAYVLRLPSFMATDESETVAVGLVQSLITEPPGSTRAYRETVRYGKTNNGMMGIPSSCYEGGVAILYYAKSDIPATASCQLYLFVPRTDWRGP